MNHRWVALIAVFIALWLYVGLPLFAVFEHWVKLKDLSSAAYFLFLTFALLGIQIFSTTIFADSFSFSQHGFGLTVSAFAGFVTIVGTALLKGEPTGKLIINLMAGSFFMILLSLFIADSARSSASGSMPPAARLTSYAIGAVTFEAYIYAMLLELK
jgi:hypothetical protein